MKTNMFVSLCVLSIALPGMACADEAPKPWDQADQIYDPAQMQASRMAVQHHGGAQQTAYFMLDRLETQFHHGETSLAWDGMASFGGDVNKLWIKTEGEASLNGNGVESAELQALYSRAISPFWNLQGGVRYDSNPRGHTYGAVSLTGLAPYWFEVDASVFLRDDGNLYGRLEAEYDWRLTQRLVLQPRMEAELAAQDSRQDETGAGLGHLDAGLRLRYEVGRQFAPYVGIEWQSAYGGTADYVRASGESASKAVFLIGIRSWY